jgi:DNA-directed RNA polymerase subunit alpha
MQAITLPKKSKVVETEENSGKFIIEDCYPGYGTTLGNALRRVLLSSLDGAAVTAIKIKGVSHEFSTVDGILEDVVQIILNVKKIRFKFFGEEPVRISISKNGKGEIVAKDIKTTSDVEIVNGDQLIATATSAKAEFEMELEVSHGLGYVPVDQQEKREEIGWINIDSIYTPIKRVNYDVENMRVGKRTDYDRIVLEIKTDGSIDPREAFDKAVKILVKQFSVLAEGVVEAPDGMEESGKVEEYEAILNEEKEVVVDTTDEDSLMDLSIEELKGLSTRTVNALKDNKVKKVKSIVKLSNKELEDLEGMGEKGVKEIKKAIGSLGLILKNK